MNSSYFKGLEIFSNLRVIPPIVVRVDGRNFKKSLHRLELARPYDEVFVQAMVASVEAFFRQSGLTPLLAYTFSDEISILFREVPFNRRLEKLNSVIPSFLSSALTLKLAERKPLPTPLAFDSRVIPLKWEEIRGYLAWRQAEAWRNHLNSYAYYLLRQEGMTAAEAAGKLKNLDASSIHELAWSRGVNLAETPTWQRRGILVYRQIYEKKGYNPLKGTETLTKRSQVKVDWQPPIFKSTEGEKLLDSILKNTKDTH